MTVAKIKAWLKVVVGFSALGLFAACGGGGGGSSGSSGGGAPGTYNIGVTVSGLTGTGLVLQDNGAPNLTVSTNGTQTFNTGLATGSAYAVTVLTQPTGEICNVANGSGTVGAGNVDVAVTCSTSTLTANTFTVVTATMTSARQFHTATLLPNGKVLLTGGFNGSRVLNTAELYDPVANTFTALSATTGTPIAMTTARQFHTATLLPNGKVLLTGGTDGSRILNTAELYDPVANTFTALSATMTTARAYHTATLLPNGLALLTGGWNGSPTALNTAELYDPVANTFTALSATMTTARAYHTATLLPNGEVLLTGGWNGSGSILNTAEVYEALPPSAQTFTALSATMTTAREGHRATLLPNGQVLVTGGFNNGSSALNTAELYDPVANTFTALTATMTSARQFHMAALLPNGQVLLTGGTDGSGTVLNTAELYDPVAQTFTALSATTGTPITMTSTRQGHTATLLPNGQVLLTGGTDGSGTVLNTAELYDPVAQTFTALSATTGTPITMTSTRQGHTATLLPNGQVLLTGGGNSTTAPALNTAELYDPTANTFTALTATMTTARAYDTATLLPNGQVLLTGGGNSTTAPALNTAELYDP